MSIGNNIKKLRLLHDMSQQDLARIAGVTDKAVSSWENDVKTPRIGTIQKIADYFNIKKSDIIEDHNIVEVIKNLEKSTQQGKGFFEQHLLDKNSPSSAFPTQYYDDPVVAQMANDLKENPDMRVLFDASRRLSPRDLAAVINIVKSINGDED